MPPTKTAKPVIITEKREKYWVKVHIYEGTYTFSREIKNLGELNVYMHIISTFNRTTGEWSNTKQNRQAITQIHEIADNTIFRYLSHLVRTKLLLKSSRGHYKVNP